MSQTQKMGPETWIMLAAMAFLLVLVVMAVTPDDRPAAAGKGMPLVAPVPVAGLMAEQPTTMPQAQTVAQLQPAQMQQTFTYSGVIDEVINLSPGGWGQIHLMVNDGAGLVQEVSLAPEWYLSFQGCQVRRGIHAEGEGFHFDGLTEGGLLYAKNVVVNGVRCRLRTVEGLALWTDQLR